MPGRLRRHRVPELIQPGMPPFVVDDLLQTAAPARVEAGLLLKLDVLKKCIGLVYLLVSMQFGVKWIAVSLIAFYFTSMVINIAPNRKILNYGYWEQFKDVAGNIIPAVIMGACVYPLSLLQLPTVALLALQIIAGVGVYIGLSIVTKNKSFFFVLSYVRQNVLHRIKAQKS